MNVYEESLSKRVNKRSELQGNSTSPDIYPEDEKEMTDYDKMFKAGNKAQLEQMVKYDRIRSGWDNFPILESFEGIRKAAVFIERMLFHEFTNTSKPLTKSQVEILRSKAANISNYAHMIILNCDEEVKK